MGRSTKRKVFRQSLTIEGLERRQLFATDFANLVYHVPEPTNPLQIYISQKHYQQAVSSGTFDALSNEADFDTKLKELVGEYWLGVLGKQPSEIEIANNYPAWFGGGVLQEFVALRAVTFDSANLASTRSITTTRHAGIDEADSADMTSDGYLYTVVANSVHVANLRDPSRIEVDEAFPLGGYSAQLFVVGDALIVIEAKNSDALLRINGYAQSTPQTKVSLYDISQRMSPREVSTTIVEGANIAARLTAGQLTLVLQNETLLPEPMLITDSVSVERYESLDSYFAANRDAIVAALTPDYARALGSQPLGASLNSGEWNDLSFANDSLTRSTTVLRFELVNSNLTLIDSETIAGLTAGLVYQGADDIYLVGNSQWFASEQTSYIYKVDATGAGQLKAMGMASVKGNVNDTTWLNEHNGVLQVATTDSVADEQAPADALIFLPRGNNRANITTIGDTVDGWKVLGTLEDIGDGQGLLAANFVGERAVITTGTPQLIDPLHGIDLSDPSHPVELSELTIPGFTTFLMQIDATHWLGFGFDQNVENRMNRLQVSLYNVADFANPVLVDRWTSANGGWGGWGRTWDPHGISFDPATGLLVMASSQEWTGDMTRMPILKVDVAAEDPLRELGITSSRESINRAFTLDSILVTVSNHSVAAFDVADVSSPLGLAYIGNYNELSSLYWNVASGSNQDFRLADQWYGESFVIIDIETSGEITATLKPDQSTVTLTAPASTAGVSQEFTLTLKFESGHTRTVKGLIYAYTPYVPVPYSEARASLNAQFTDDDGNILTELVSGDEVWVTIEVTDLRENGSGVFGAYVDVGFESQNVTLVGSLEHLGFSNGKTGVVTGAGIQSFGGFDAMTRPDSTTAQLGRFKIRVEDDKPVVINVTPSTGLGNEVLLYDLGQPLNPANVSPAVLTTQSETMRSMVTGDNRLQDVNSDGVITPLDALLVINYINARVAASAESAALMTSSTVVSSYDLSGDGIVSAIDVLQIVNTINASSDASASGEGRSLEASAVDLEPLLLDLKMRQPLQVPRRLSSPSWP